jgi:amidase
MFETHWIEDQTINSLQEKMKHKKTSARELVLTYLQRIASIDSSGPTLKSIIEVNPDALALADMLDKERREGVIRGPLHGIPIVIKDNIDTNDRMHTTAGSVLLANHYAKKDAFIVKKLREAGAILLGKSNLTEWANFIAQGMPTGYSSRGGQTLNPYGKSFMVGGSSAGTGAAIAANLAVAGIGTETSGSILSPASQNALVGIKPTVGMVSRSGIIPISTTQDTAGPMTRTVADAVHLLSVIQGVDENDPVTGSNPFTADESFTTYLKEDGLKRKRIGVARNPYFAYISEEKQKIMDDAIEKLREQGAEIIEEVEISSEDVKWSIDVMLYEFKAAIEVYLKTVEDDQLNTLQDLIRKNQLLGSKALKYGQAIFMRAASTTGRLTDKEYLEALIHDQNYSREKGIDQALEKYQLDAIITPNNMGAAIPAKAGYPSITVPAKLTKEGEPVGVTFTASAYSEPILIECAYAFEQATKYRTPPQF